MGTTSGQPEPLLGGVRFSADLMPADNSIPLTQAGFYPDIKVKPFAHRALEGMWRWRQFTKSKHNHACGDVCNTMTTAMHTHP